MNLLNITDLSATDITNLWALADGPVRPLHGTVAWSFEGNGVRTRTTFIQAFRDLGLSCTQLPNLLKSSERACDLAGYLDEFYSLYVVRESNHERLQEFASASRHPVINAMSSKGHPCEVLADAYWIQKEMGPIENIKIGLWGPTTNVFRSWHELAGVLNLEVVHFCDAECHTQLDHVLFRTIPNHPVDILITDSWPSGTEHPSWSLTVEHLSALGNPRLLPTPPFSIGKELGIDPTRSGGFVGYEQKRALLPVQRAVLTYALR